MSDFSYNSQKQLVFAGHVLSKYTQPDQNPFYLYSETILQEQLHKFRTAITTQLNKSPKIFFAMKANPSAKVIAHFVKHGVGVDVVSLGEIKKSLAAGNSAANTVYSGVGKRVSEIRQAIELGVQQINVESIEELQRIVDIAQSLPITSAAVSGIAPAAAKKVSIALRVNPEVDVRTHPYIATGLKENKFGIEMARLPEAIEIFRRAEAAAKAANRPCPVQWVGLSLHIGSQLKEFESLRVSLQKIKNVFQEIRSQGFDLKVFDVGGGLGIAYEGDRKEDEKFLQQYAAVLGSELKDFPADIQLEPGRCLTARAGVLVTEVQYRKLTSHKTFLVVSSGMNHLLRPSLYEAYHRIFPLQDNSETEVVDVVGPVCESSDFYAKDRRLPKVKAGDFLAIADVGAYGMSMASTYNSFDLPDEIWLS